MGDRKRIFRIFTISDFEEEENWLEEQHRNGWEFEKVTANYIYNFEKVSPEEVVYKLDYQMSNPTDDYLQMYRDYGWEYLGSVMGWHYFRKKKSDISDANDGEIFSDNESKIQMIDNIFKTRMIPLLVIFFAIIIPQLSMGFSGKNSFKIFIFVVYIVLFLLYVYVFIHCGLKLKEMKNRLKNN